MLAAVLLPFAVAALAPWLAQRFGGRAGWLLAPAPLLASLPVVRALPLAPGDAVVERLSWAPGFGVALGFRLDGLAAVFALLICGIGALILVYAGGYLAGDRRLGRLLATLLVFLGAMLGLVLADDVITLFVFWELTSVCSFLLVGFDHEKAAARAAALKALVVTGAGGLVLLAGLVMARAAAVDLGVPADLAGTVTGLASVELTDHPLYLAILVLVVLAAATKSAQVPFHFWLPAAMAAPTPVSAFLHSATMVKAGIYLLARMSPVLGGTPEWRWGLTGLGLLTMLTGAAMALPQRDLKKILAYSTVSVLGILTLLLGIGTDLAIKSMVVFLVAHALYKASLFMVAGNLDHETGTRELDRLGGLRRLLPWTAAAGLLAGLSKAGAPPMFGFIGKELLYKTKLDAVDIGFWLVIAAVAANIALVATALMVGVRPFWGARRESPRTPHEAPAAMVLGPLVLGIAGIVIGAFPTAFENGVGSAAASSIAGKTLVMDLKLWHGVNTDALLVLALSGATLGIGFAVYLASRRGFRRLAEGCRRLGQWGPTRLFETVLDALPTAAGAITRRLQTGVLRHYLLLAVAATVAVTAPPLVRWAAGATPQPFAAPGPFELTVALLIVGGGLVAVLFRSRLASVAALGVTGISVALVFVLFSAPDLAMTQVMVETLSVIVLVLVFSIVPRFVRRCSSSQRIRDLLVASSLGLVMALLVLLASTVDLEPDASRFYLEASVPEAKGRNVVNVILVDFRALDTLGEIVVVAVAGFGVAALIGWRFGLREPAE
ncbi:MAG: hydrogen gas-evolving membrane-bound hydrogenase subunit E [Candidatus Sulfomarinibacteraceae bacterium]